MKKIILQIPLPDFIEVQAPATWKTDVGTFDNMLDVYAIESTINFFKNNRERDYLINAHHDIRKLLVKGLLERNSSSKTHLSNDHRLVESISSLIFRFRDGTGYKIDDYEFTWEVACKGTKISVRGTNYIYEDVHDYIRTVVHNYTNYGRFNDTKMFEYTIVDE